MKGCTHWGRHMLAVLLAGAMLVSELPAAVAADMPTTRLHLTPPESGQVQTTTFIQDQFNLSVIGYGAAGNTGSNVEGPNKVWNGPEVSGTTDYVENGNLTIIPTEEAGGTGLVEDDGVFQFYLHDREDYDSTGVRYDRQRIEIKSHDRSDAKAENAPALAMEDDIYTYRWKFKLPENCYTPLSENQDEKLANFFHIFQLKAIRGGENAMPVATFTIEDDYLMFQQIPISGRGMGYNNIIGDKIPLKDIEGKWLSAAVTVLYRDEGYIHVKLDDMETDTELINTGAELDTWRRPELGEGATTYESDFPAVVGQGIRCKWGLYRKYIPDAYRLNPEEGGNSAINEAALPSWWTDAAMWVGDIEVKREDRSSYRFPAGFDVGDYTLPAEGEGLEEHSAPLDGGINYAKDASIKICGKEGNSHDGDKLLDGDETTSWDTPKAMLNTDSANANKVYWAALDLGAVHDINKFIIQFNTTSNKLCGYQIYSAGADGKAAYDEIQDGQTDDPRKLTHWDAWDEVEGVGYHPGVNKYVKAYQMNIFDAANGSFDALEDVQYLLILGDVVHDNSEKSIKTTMFKAINTDEQPEIPSAGYDLGENLAAGDQVRVKVSTASEHKPDGMSLNPKEYTSQFLIDNDDTTVWSTNSSQVNENVASAGYKYWAAVDLGEEKEINQFRIKWGTVSDRLSSYQVFFSSEDDDFNSLIERMGTITPDESGKAPTKNPIAEQGNQWKPATNKVTRGVANNEEVILSVENDATAEDISTIEQTEQESELNASEQSDEENEETKDETDDSESTDIPKETADSEQPEEKVQDEDAVAENLMFLPNENDVYAALPSMFGTLARAKAVSEQETEAPSITARYLLLLCDVNVTEKAGAINTASFEAFHAVPTTVAVECHAERLGTIKMLPGLIKDEITAALLPQRFSVKLTGGINYALMVDWNQEDIDKLNPDEPGTYEIRGTLLVPEDVTLDFETNDVSKEIVRVIVIEEPKQEESQPPVDPDDPDQPPVDPDDPNQPPVDPDDPNQPPVDPDDPNQPPVDPDDPNQPPVDPDDPDQPPVDPDDPNQPPVDPDDPDQPPVDPDDPNKPPVDPDDPNKPPVDPDTPSKPPVDTDDTESTGNHSRPTRPAASRPQGNSTAGTTTPETPKNETLAGQTPSQATGTTAQPTEFKDVQRGDWFVDAVEYVSARGMMNGSGGEFRPNERLTRAMIAQILYNLEGAAGGVPANFPDITADDWCAAAVGWASQSGIMSGYNSGLFGANDSITREQLALTLYRYAQRKGYDLNAAAEFSGFADRAAVSDWALPAMRWAVANGLISGKSDGRLDAHGTATRAEVASILMRFCETFMR